MARIAMVGDMHGNTNQFVQTIQALHELRVHAVYQLGDFGLWDHHADGVEYLDRLNRTCQEYDVTVLAVPGNHENYDSLEEKAAQQGNVRLIELRSRVFIVNRVSSWAVGKTIFYALGGAVSVDREWRVPHVSYWDHEMITESDLNELQSLRNVNSHKKFDNVVMLSHDAPRTFPAPLWKQDPLSDQSREMISYAYDMINPTRGFHGHYHVYNNYEYGNADITGLAADLQTQSGRDPYLFIYDTETGRGVSYNYFELGAESGLW